MNPPIWVIKYNEGKTIKGTPEKDNKLNNEINKRSCNRFIQTCKGRTWDEIKFRSHEMFADEPNWVEMENGVNGFGEDRNDLLSKG